MFQYIAGVDEAGRGPLAGPVTVGCVCATKDSLPEVYRRFSSAAGRDSKKMTEAQRERYYRELVLSEREGLLKFASVSVSARYINRFGIVRALRHGVAASLRLMVPAVTPDAVRVLLDGSLSAPRRYALQETLVRGDERELLIGLASVVAKVRRDRHMRRLARHYPEYGFDRNMGYGTVAHRRALRTHGPTPEHRTLFVRRIDAWRL